MESIINDDSTVDQPDSELTDQDILDRYKMEIQLYDKEYKTWEKRCNKIVKRYKDERAETQTNPTRFNILYSNVQTLFPAAYGNDPKPDIQRRFKDDDVLGRVTSDVLERCTSYQVNAKFSDTVKHCLQDRLLPGRGVSWIRYEPHFRDVALPNQETDGEITEYVYSDEEKESGTTQEVYYEEVCHDYVYWKDFGHNVARIWDEVYFGWRKVYLTKQELINRFGKKIAAICPMDYSPRGLSEEKKNEVMKKSTIYEGWDKTKKKVYWIHKDVDQFLDVKNDPLDLPEFFPFPKPLLGIVTNDSLVPVPDYFEYQDQAMELDELTSRISQITKSIKVVGVYDASAAGVERMLNEGVENRLIAVESWAVFGEKGGLKGAMELMPVKELMETLLGLYEAREKVKNDLYEITGIADIIRGASKASETATAQNIKSQFATLRLDTIQHSVARFAKDMVVNTALIIAKHFSLDTIKQISGVQLMTAQEKQQFQMQQQQAQLQQQQWQMVAQQAKANGQQPPAQPPAPPPIDDKTQELLDNPTWEEVYQLLQDQPHLTFRIDIETDSTIKGDEQADQAARMEFLKSAGGFIEQSAQVALQQPEMMPLMVQMLLFGVRGFKVGKSIEGAFRTILQKVEKQASQPQPPKPDPEMEKIKADQASQQARAQADMQVAQAKTQSDQQSQAAKLQSDKEIAAAKLQGDIMIEQMRIQAEKEKTLMQIAADMEKARMDAAADADKQDKDISAKKEVATISAHPPEVVKTNNEMKDVISQMMKAHQDLSEKVSEAQKYHEAPREITLDNGRKATVRTNGKSKEITLDNGRKATVQ